MPARVKCAELAWHTLEEMLEAHNSGSTAAGTSTTEDGSASANDNSVDSEYTKGGE